MSVSTQFIENHARREEYIESAKASLFFGVPVGDLTKDDLLMMIGLVGMEKIREEEFHRKVRETFGAFHGTPKVAGGSGN